MIKLPLLKASLSVAFGSSNIRLTSKESVVLISLTRRDSDKSSNVLIRGVGQTGILLRPQVKIVSGRMFRLGLSEIIAGKSIADRYNGAGIGEKLYFGKREWTVVGIFDAGKNRF